MAESKPLILKSKMVDIKTYLNEKRELVEAALRDNMVPATPVFEEHLEAMRYSLYAGGKRIRPILCLAAAQAVSDAPEEIEAKLLPIACGLECIHTYSLIHDDLPAMDNDDLRRGKPTNHKVFGEASAILAGDSLLTWAFDLISTSHDFFNPKQQLAMIHEVARASGPLGMVGGQALDIAHENKDFPFSMLQTIHRNKTGALITCAIRVGAIGGGASSNQLQQLTFFGEKIGLAFQIVDDLLNATATTEQLGKSAGSDKIRGKATYPAYFGLDTTREKAQAAVSEAINALADFDDRAEPLRGLAEYVRTRSR